MVDVDVLAVPEVQVHVAHRQLQVGVVAFFDLLLGDFVFCHIIVEAFVVRLGAVTVLVALRPSAVVVDNRLAVKLHRRAEPLVLVEAHGVAVRRGAQAAERVLRQVRRVARAVRAHRPTAQQVITAFYQLLQVNRDVGHELRGELAVGLSAAVPALPRDPIEVARAVEHAAQVVEQALVKRRLVEALVQHRPPRAAHIRPLELARPPEAQVPPVAVFEVDFHGRVVVGGDEHVREDGQLEGRDALWIEPPIVGGRYPFERVVLPLRLLEVDFVEHHEEPVHQPVLVVAQQVVELAGFEKVRAPDQRGDDTVHTAFTLALRADVDGHDAQPRDGVVHRVREERLHPVGGAVAVGIGRQPARDQLAQQRAPHLDQLLVAAGRLDARVEQVGAVPRKRVVVLAARRQLRRRHGCGAELRVLLRRVDALLVLAPVVDELRRAAEVARVPHFAVQDFEQRLLGCRLLGRRFDGAHRVAVEHLAGVDVVEVALQIRVLVRGLFRVMVLFAPLLVALGHLVAHPHRVPQQHRREEALPVAPLLAVVVELAQHLRLELGQLRLGRRVRHGLGQPAQHVRLVLDSVHSGAHLGVDIERFH